VLETRGLPGDAYAISYHRCVESAPADNDAFAMTGDDGVGDFTPPLVRPPGFPRISADLLAEVRALSGAATTGADVLDELGLALTVPVDALPQRTGHGVTVGQALTVAYVPERRALWHPDIRRSPSRLAHHTLFEMARDGDVVVVDVRGTESISVLGGMAAGAARKAGIAGFVVDGGVRDLDEIASSGLSVWSRWLTPRTGKWRLEASTLNLPVVCGGVQVHPGDVVVADHTGVCFFPVDVAETALRQLLDTVAQERRAAGR
jgi:4-hydroxy-4-methyl-2-oxoglutarate aldolase